MAPLQANNDLPNPSNDTHRGQSHLNRLIHSRWLAMFVVAFAVSWSFHQADEIGTHKIQRQQRILTCTIEGVAGQQATMKAGRRVAVQPILDQCAKREGK